MKLGCADFKCVTCESANVSVKLYSYPFSHFWRTLMKCEQRFRNVAIIAVAGLPWRPVMTTLVLFTCGELPLQVLLWRSRTIMLVLRLTDFDLCRLSTTGPWLACRLGLWPNRSTVIIGILSLPVSSPKVWENLVILRRWDLICPFESTNRRQLMTTSCRLRRRPRWWYPVWTLTTDTPGELLTNSGVLDIADTAPITWAYRRLPRELDCTRRSGSLFRVDNSSTMTLPWSTLRSKTVSASLRPTS